MGRWDNPKEERKDHKQVILVLSGLASVIVIAFLLSIWSASIPQTKTTLDIKVPVDWGKNCPSQIDCSKTYILDSNGTRHYWNGTLAH